MILHDLWAVLWAESQHTGELVDLDIAVEAGRATVAGARESALGLDEYLVNLFGQLMTHIRASPDDAHFREILAVAAEGLEILSADDLRRPTLHSGIWAAWNLRFEQTSDERDLVEAIDAARAVAELPGLPSESRAEFLDMLSMSHEQRFVVFHDRNSLNEAITATRSAIAAARPHDAKRTDYLHRLQHLARLRFEIDGRVADLDDASGTSAIFGPG
jgi:hypothetical protein